MPDLCVLTPVSVSQLNKNEQQTIESPHIPVLAKEIASFFQFPSNSLPIIIDATFGAGGHSRILLG